MRKNLVRNLLIGLATLSMVTLAQASPKTLIKYKGGNVTPGLASSAKAQGAGKYLFTLGSHKVGGNALTPAMVKTSIEEKLGSKGVSVAPQGANAVLISYTGDEKTFLTGISRTKIKSGSTSLAVDSSVSDGGIRARIPARPALPHEVKAKFLSANGDTIKLIVVNPGKQGLAAKVKPGQILDVKGRGNFQAKKADQFLFTPKANQPTWVGANFTFK